MREIKFRAWDKNSKEWNSTFYMDAKGRLYDNGRELEDGIETLDLVLMQYTGLKDKNGKEIWEGDIVICHPAVAEDIQREQGRRYTVVYHAPDWLLELPEGGMWEELGACDKCGSHVGGGDGWWCTNEVIGNIYENKELLTK